METKTLQAAALMPSNSTFWTKVTIALVDYNQRFYFLCCPKCTKSIGSNLDGSFTCRYCSLRNVIHIPRCIVEVQLSDGTGKMNAYACGDVADDILGCTAVQLMQTLTTGNREAIKYVANVNVSVLKLIKVRITQNQFEQGGVKRFNVLETHVLQNEDKISKLEEGKLKVLPIQLTTFVASNSADSYSVSEEPEEKTEHFLKMVYIQPITYAATAFVEPHSLPEKVEAETDCPFSAADKPAASRSAKPKRRSKKEFVTQQTLRERFEAGDPQVGALGELTGKFDFYVLYSGSATDEVQGSPNPLPMPPSSWENNLQPTPSRSEGLTTSAEPHFMPKKLEAEIHRPLSSADKHDASIPPSSWEDNLQPPPSRSNR